MDFLFWQEQWANRVKRRKSQIKENPNMDFWDMHAPDFSSYRKSRDYEFGRKITAVFNSFLQSHNTVLDIGAGPGSFVIPLCEKYKHVTAAEPSDGMLKELRKNCMERNITNFDIVQSTIEELQPNMTKAPYDLVVCSLVLWLFEDVWPMIEHIESFSKKYCSIVVNVPDLKYVNGELRGDVQEFQCLYNLLISGNRVAHVSMVEYTGEKNISDEVRYQSMLRAHYDKDLTDDIVNEIRESVMEQTTGKTCIITSRSAVIWWDKEERFKSINPF